MKRTARPSSSSETAACQYGFQPSAMPRPIIQAIQPPITTVTSRKSQIVLSS